METLDSPRPLRPNHKSGPRETSRFGFTAKRTLFAILHSSSLSLPPFFLLSSISPHTRTQRSDAHYETKFGCTDTVISIAHDDPSNRFDLVLERREGFRSRDKMSGVWDRVGKRARWMDGWKIFKFSVARSLKSRGVLAWNFATGKLMTPEVGCGTKGGSMRAAKLWRKVIAGIFALRARYSTVNFQFIPRPLHPRVESLANVATSRRPAFPPH